MTPDEQGQRLHDRITRGEVLSADERSLVDQWYARHDADEAAALARSSPPQDLSDLRQRVDATVAKVRTITQQIQTLTADTETVRRDVLALQRQLAQRTATQPV